MIYDVILRNIRTMLDERFPNSRDASKELSDILGVEKIGIYRRLNGIVQFTAAEIALICNKLNISIDAILRVNPTGIHSLTFLLHDYSALDDDDYKLMEETLSIFEAATSTPGSRIVMGGNHIPDFLWLPYKNLVAFYGCKWQYFYHSVPGGGRPFSEVITPEKFEKIFERYVACARRFDSTTYVWDEDTIRCLVKDVKYMESINLITSQEREAIKKDLTDMLENLRQVSMRGYWDDPSKEVNIYVCSMSLQNSYVFIDSEKIKRTTVLAFILNAISTQEIETFNRVKIWMQSLLKASTLISTSGEIARINFFDRQFAHLKDL